MNSPQRTSTSSVAPTAAPQPLPLPRRRVVGERPDPAEERELGDEGDERQQREDGVLTARDQPRVTSAAVAARWPAKRPRRRSAMAAPLTPFGGDLLLEGDDPLEQRLGPRRAAGDVDVDGHELVDAFVTEYESQYGPPELLHAPKEMTYLGSGIWS